MILKLAFSEHKYLFSIFFFRGLSDIDDYELHKLVFAVAEKSILDDGTLCPPPAYPPAKPAPPPASTQPQYGYYNQGYTTGGAM